MKASKQKCAASEPPYPSRKEARSFCSPVTFEIVHQATMSQLISMTEPEIMDTISLSLQIIPSTQKQFYGPVRISAPRLLEPRRLEFVACTETRADHISVKEIETWQRDLKQYSQLSSQHFKPRCAT